MPIQPIILCGGSGSRLWPESRKSLPKQFVKIFNSKSLLDLTLERIKSMNNCKGPIIVTSKNLGFLVKESLDRSLLQGTLILEPEGKNTTAAIYLAALASDINDRLLLLASDQIMPDHEYFANSVSKVDQIANGLD